MVEFSVNWWWASFYLLLAFAITYWFYRKDNLLSTVSKGLKFILFFLRFSVLFCLLFLLLNPILTAYKEFKQEPILLLLTDNSESISLFEKDTSKLKSQIEQFSDKLNVICKTESSAFDKNLVQSINFKGKSTNFQSAMNEVENTYLQSNVVGVVLISDGIVTEGANPLDVSMLNVPVFALGLGDTSLRKDLILKEVYHNKITYLNNEFPIEVQGLAKNAIGNTLKIKVLYDGNLISEKSISITQILQDFTFETKLKATQIGTHKITAQVEVIKGEITKSNNVLSSYIDVLDERQRIVVLYQNPHPDIAAYKNSFLGNDNYKLETRAFKEGLIDLSKYNLVLVFGMPDNRNDFRTWEEKLLKSSANVLFVLNSAVNYSFFSPSLISVKSRVNQSNDAVPLFNSNFELFNFSKEEQNTMSSYPPLTVPFGDITLPFEVSTLFYQKIASVHTDLPLITFGDVANKKVGIVVGEGIWRWKLQEARNNPNGETPVFNHMIQQMSKYLFIQEEKSNFMLDYKKSIQEDERMLIGVQLFNKTYEKINTAEVNLQLISKDKKVLNYTFPKTNDAYLLDIGLLSPGEYQFTASTLFNGKKINRTGRFIVNEIKLESINLQANHQLLKRMANLYGGDFQTFSNRDKILEKIKLLDFKNKTFYDKVKDGLINYKWIALLLLVLINIEWFLRKWYGTI